jgi:hypothetical protein
MLIWGYNDRERQEGAGQFWCPRCQAEQDYVLIRTWQYFHVYFIPLGKEELVGEHIVCAGCNHTFPSTVLTGEAESILPLGTAGTNLPSSGEDSIVTLTPSAVEEIRRRHFEGEFEANVAVRIEPDPREPNKVLLAFDMLLDDERDLICQSAGIPILVDRRIAHEVQGSTIDFRYGSFVVV